MGCRGALRAVGALDGAHPDNAEGVAFDRGLSMVVDAAARSQKSADEAYYALEDMHAQVHTHHMRMLERSEDVVQGIQLQTCADVVVSLKDCQH